jgi:hypothetical protein
VLEVNVEGDRGRSFDAEIHHGSGSRSDLEVGVEAVCLFVRRHLENFSPGKGHAVGAHSKADRQSLVADRTEALGPCACTSYLSSPSLFDPAPSSRGTISMRKSN